MCDDDGGGGGGSSVSQAWTKTSETSKLHTVRGKKITETIKN